MSIEICGTCRLSMYVQSIPEAVADGRLQIKRSQVRFPHWNIFFFTPFSFFFLSHFFPLSFSFMLAPPLQCSSFFLVGGASAAIVIVMKIEKDKTCMVHAIMSRGSSPKATEEEVTDSSIGTFLPLFFSLSPFQFTPLPLSPPPLLSCSLHHFNAQAFF